MQKEKYLIDKATELLKNKANRLYEKCILRPNSKLASRCCNFKLLEEKAKLYSSHFMKAIKLQERTEETVKVYFKKANHKDVKKFLPQKAKTLDEALEDYRKTLLPDSTSFGKTIWVNEKYIGDIWCYCVDKNEMPNAMVSYCIFDKNYWEKGVATEALRLFLEEAQKMLQIETFGAFTYSENMASIRVLEKNNFMLKQTIIEEEIESKYYQYN